MPMNTVATIHAGTPKKNGMFGCSVANTTNSAVASKPRPISSSVGKCSGGSNVTIIAGTTVMTTIITVNRTRPTIPSTACPMIQKNNMVSTSQMWLGGLAIGHVNRRQISPLRTATGSKISLLNVSFEIA